MNLKDQTDILRSLAYAEGVLGMLPSLSTFHPRTQEAITEAQRRLNAAIERLLLEPVTYDDKQGLKTT